MGDVQVGLLVRPAKIALESLPEAVFVVLEHVADLGDLRLPEFDRPRPARPECCLGGGMDLVDRQRVSSTRPHVNAGHSTFGISSSGVYVSVDMADGVEGGWKGWQTR